MKNAIVYSLVGLLLTAQVSVSADDAAPANDAATVVAKLVRQLDAAEKGRREDAEQQLLKLGPAILPLLPNADSASAEVKLRLARVRTQLETLQGEQQVKASELSLAASGDAARRRVKRDRKADGQ